MSHDPRPIREERVKKHVKELLKKHGCYFFMPVQSGFGAATLDFLGCHKGRFFAVETKAPGKHLTARQELVQQMIEAVGSEGIVFIVGEQYIPGHHVYEGFDKKPKLKDTFSGMGALEGWLLLGP